MTVNKCFYYLFLIAFLGFGIGCDQLFSGNLPGIRVDVPVYPKGQIKGTSKETITCVPSNQRYKVNTVIIETDASATAILEFYKGMLPEIRITDFGSYWGIEYVPEGWKAGDRIEIWVSKDTYSDLSGYDVKQFRKK